MAKNKKQKKIEKVMKKRDERPDIMNVRKSMPCPTGTKVFKDKKKEQSKKKCRKKDINYDKD